MLRHAGFLKRKCRLEGNGMRRWDPNSSSQGVLCRNHIIAVIRDIRTVLEVRDGV